MNKREAGNPAGPREVGQQANGFEHDLKPLRPLDVAAANGFAELLTAMKDTAFGGRQLGEAADVLMEMTTDPDCFVIGSFSGAMTVAKQGLLLCEMIDRGMLDAVVSTGAMMAHGLVETHGLTHFKVEPDMDDRALYYAGYDRVYDTLELENNLDDIEQLIYAVLDRWPAGEPCCSRTLFEAHGRQLCAEHPDGRGILLSAARKGVPIYVPAFTDSELGLDFGLWNRRARRDGRSPVRFDPFLDLDDYTDRVARAKRLGIFTIGGGVPRNWAQQAGPYTGIIDKRLGGQGTLCRFRYAVRICPEPVHWGGLSGCTYAEGISWGKFVPPSEGGRFAEVAADATIAWPVLLAAVMARLDSEPVHGDRRP